MGEGCTAARPRGPAAIPAARLGGIPAARPAATLAAILAVALAPSHAMAQNGAEGERLYMDTFGCWTCHGRVADGAGGEGPPLVGTRLPVSLFVKKLRLPRTTMPPFSPFLATDDELAVVYAWLGGADPVVVPTPVRLEPRGFAGMSAGIETEVGFEARAGRAGAAAARRVRYRLTLFAQDDTRVEGVPLDHRVLPGGDWAHGVTDREGRVVVGPEDGIAVQDLEAEAGAGVGLRLALPAGRYVLVVEAVDATEVDEPATYGIGTALITTAPPGTTAPHVTPTSTEMNR